MAKRDGRGADIIDLVSDDETGPASQSQPSRRRNRSSQLPSVTRNGYQPLPRPKSLPQPSQEVIVIDTDSEAEDKTKSPKRPGAPPEPRSLGVRRIPIQHVLNPLPSKPTASPSSNSREGITETRARAIPSKESTLSNQPDVAGLETARTPNPVPVPAAIPGVRETPPSPFKSHELPSSLTEMSKPETSRVREDSQPTSQARKEGPKTLIRLRKNSQHAKGETGEDQTVAPSRSSGNMDPRRTGPIVPEFQDPRTSPIQARTNSKQIARKSARSERVKPSSGVRPLISTLSSGHRQRGASRTSSPSKSQTTAKIPDGATSKHGPLVNITSQNASKDSSGQGAQERPGETTTAPTATAIDNEQLASASEVIQSPKSKSENRFSKDALLSQADVDKLFQKQLIEYHENHAYSVKSILRRQRISLTREVMARKRAGIWSPSYVRPIPDENLQSHDPFADMEAIQIPTTKKPKNGQYQDYTHEMLHGARAGARTYFSVPVTSVRSTSVDIPSFHEYVSLHQNVLAENNRKLLYWPYFYDCQDEDQSKAELWDELLDRFDMPKDERALHVEREEQGRVLQTYIDNFLTDVNVTWEDILFWNLAYDSDLQRIMSDHLNSVDIDTLLANRALSRDEELDQEKAKWRDLLARISTPSFRKIWHSALACQSSIKHYDLNLWHLARRSEAAQTHLLDVLQGSKKVPPSNATFAYREQTCRICHEFDCPFHGEIREDPESGTDIPTLERNQSSASSLDEEMSRGSSLASGSVDDQEAALNTKKLSEDPESDSDSDIEPVNNYRKIVTGAKPALRQPDLVEPTPRNFNVNHWLKDKSNTYDFEKRRPFYPCKHEGSCETANCSCFEQKITCERTCGCAASCKRRYPGCSCGTDTSTQVCGVDSKCECQRLNRECDADLCGTCGATDVMDPNNRYDEEVLRGKCCNMGIQRNVPKKTLLGHSELHGFGLYLGERVKANEYIGEYKGEVITRGEGDRRGTIYTHKMTTYLFSLSKDQEVDSTRAGNKMRFINHAHEHYTNCYPKVRLCNSVVRIGFYAKYDLTAGTELFFDYGYPDEMTKDFRQPRHRYVTQQKAPIRIAGKGTAAKKHKVASRRLKKPGLRAASHRSTSESRKKVSLPPERLEQLAKARATKAAKRAQLLSNDISTLPPVMQKARKSVSINAPKRPQHYRATFDTPEGLRPEEEFQYLANRKEADDEEEASAAIQEPDASSSSNVQNTQSQDYIPETDFEDDDFTDKEEEAADDEHEDIAIFDVPFSEVEGSASEDDSDDAGGGSRLRNSLGGIFRRQENTRRAARRGRPPASEKTKRQSGGRRERPARKRKRVFGDQDEEEYED